MTKMRIICISFLMLMSCSLSRATVFDLNTWEQLGPAENGNWIVSAGGNSVTQTYNQLPSILASPFYFGDNTFTGTFGVNTSIDDDYIGFVFGMQSLDDFYLFDWKQGDEGTARAGFTLAHVTGGLDAIPFGEHQTDAAGYDVLGSKLGNGWLENYPSHYFRLEYALDSLKIYVAGSENAYNYSPAAALIFEMSGDFALGSFGFYTYSQAQVIYSNFDFTGVATSAPVPEPSMAALAALGLFGLVALRKKS